MSYDQDISEISKDQNLEEQNSESLFLEKQSLSSEKQNPQKNLNSAEFQCSKNVLTSTHHSLCNDNEDRRNSLYVGNLDPKVTESMLYEKFSGMSRSPAEIKICKHKITNEPLGYAYVNFKNHADGMFITPL